MTGRTGIRGGTEPRQDGPAAGRTGGRPDSQMASDETFS
ncbi:hypothetical protein SAMN05216505_109106 [Streptomyces prasinopilosus]|uniref:Uncharacterized protein n=1 Tax=Streptomyces prasinopilosus TaxID=67344 RepID=A0A1G6VWN9_9ACTN|nr:hypothetical protein SAMN05216505_109106 [Streptomyces prasinopilosus]